MVSLGNEMINGRWHDSLAYTGTAGDPIEHYYGPTNKSDLPCTGCSLRSYCAKTGADCVAFRAWTDTGDYKEEYNDLQLRDINGRKLLISQEILDLVFVS